MATLCKTCSAPLRANTTVCDYCNVRNDIELKFTQKPVQFEQTKQRSCPKCENIDLIPVYLFENEKLIVDKCPECFGLFLDHGELEQAFTLATDSINFNPAQIDTVLADRYKLDHIVQYYPCPDCQSMMNRKNYGYKSGVVIDICKNHGIWLDSGELIHLLEWKALGGLELDQEIKIQRIQDEQKKLDQKQRDTLISQYPHHSENNQPAYWASGYIISAIIDTISSLLRAIFTRN